MRLTLKGNPLAERRFTRLAVAVAVAAGALLVAPQAMAAPAARQPAVVHVAVTKTGLTISPAAVPAGTVRFEVSTTETTSMAPGVLRLHGGVPVQQFLADYVKASSTDPTVRAAGTALIDQEASYRGGATVTATAPIQFSAVLEPGHYQVFNYMAALTPYVNDSVRELTVGSWRDGPCPHADGSILMTGSGTGSRYLTTSKLRDGNDVLVTNLTAQTNELTWLQLVPGTTDQDVSAFWAAVSQGHAPAKNIVLTQAAGLAPLSPGYSALFHVGFPPGHYLITSFMYDRKTGVRGVFQGFWKIVDVR